MLLSNGDYASTVCMSGINFDFSNVGDLESEEVMAGVCARGMRLPFSNVGVLARVRNCTGQLEFGNMITSLWGFKTNRCGQ